MRKMLSERLPLWGIPKGGIHMDGAKLTEAF